MYLPPLGSIGVALWAGAPNNPRGGFLGGGILRRIIAFFVSFCLVLGFVCSSLVSFAVAPVALVEAALVSYVASTGYKLWVDNGTGSDVLSLMSDLYSDWLFSLSGGTLTLEQIGNQNLVYADNSGHICITKTAADIFQDFSDWIQSEYSVTVGSSSNTVVVPAVSGGAYVSDGNGFVAYVVENNSLINVSGVDCYRSAQSYFSINGYPAYFLTPMRSSYYFTYYTNNNSKYIAWWAISGSPPSNLSYAYFDGSSYQNAGNFGIPSGYWSTSTWYDVSDSRFTSDIQSHSPTWPSRINPNNLDRTDLVGSNGLSVSLAQNVIDKATDLAQDYVLVFDVGADAGATATDIADSVVAGYDATTGVVPVTDTITAADVIDTPVQPYPDVDSLGLPQLGLALTTRFPFSIPWDISAIYSAISAPSQPPVKTFDLIPASVLSRWGVNANTSITIDLTEQKYAVLLAIIHWSCIIGFCFGLAVMTKRYVWTTGG